MTRDDEDRKPTPPDESGGQETPTPWWAEDAPEDSPLPEGYPERPDLSKVHELRGRMNRERATREAASRGKLARKLDEKVGKQALDLGTYTLIPTMMLAGPAVGYGLGWLLEKQFGGAPWVSVGGILFGLAAAFHQIVLILKKNTAKK
jgi:F0F1-type ATP synthase assembly protein I